MFSNFRVEYPSFWAGFFAGMLCLGIFLRMRLWMPEMRGWVRKKIQGIQRGLTKTTENRLREDTNQHAQHLHIAESLFSLDEIIIEPRLMVPILSAEVDAETVYQDIASEIIPHLPDWPELASCYGAPTFSLAESLDSGANIVIIGRPGSGKSTALAYLACQLARKSIDHSKVKERLPILVHVLDLALSKEVREIHDPLISALNSYTSALTQPHLDELIQSALHTGGALLLLDGLDEATHDESEAIIPWLGKLLDQYPGLQVIAAARSDDFHGLNRLGFKPLAMAAWGERARDQFFDRWALLWNQHITPLQQGLSNSTDPLVLTQWLKTKERYPSPFEATLKAWALFSGDARSADLSGLIESLLRRITTNPPHSRRALEHVAVHMILNQKSCLPIEEFRAQVAKYETILPVPAREEQEIATVESDAPATSASDLKTGRTSGLVSSGSQIISLFTNHGILTNHTNSQVRFSHCLFATYLAGRAFAEDGTITALVGQTDWYGRWLTLGFAGCYADLSEVINDQLARTQEDILAGDLFHMARWLSISQKQMPWRANLLRALAALAQHEYLTLGLAARAMCAIGLAGEPSAGILFRQWLRADQPNLRLLGALGCGLTTDTKAVQELETLLTNLDPKVGKAACLALVAIGNKAALDLVVNTLLQGNEMMRRAAAEALVNHAEEGMRILREGAADEDLLVRRSVVFGFMRSKQPDLITTLEKMAVEDKQWVVRNAASNGLDALRLPNPYIPKPCRAVTEIPWLIDFAGKQGVGVQAGKPARDLICAALEFGEEKEKLLALEQICMSGGDFAIRQVYEAYLSSQEPIRSAAFHALWYLAASGVTLPPLAQFGLHK